MTLQVVTHEILPQLVYSLAQQNRYLDTLSLKEFRFPALTGTETAARERLGQGRDERVVHDNDHTLQMRDHITEGTASIQPQQFVAGLVGCVFIFAWLCPSWSRLQCAEKVPQQYSVAHFGRPL